MSSDQIAGLLPLVLLVLVFWFLILRPARKRQREAQQTQQSLEVGARVMLTSGIFATVEDLDEQTLDLELAPGTTVTAHRQSVARVVEQADEVEDEDDETDYEADDETDAEAEAEDEAEDEADTSTEQPETDGNQR